MTVTAGVNLQDHETERLYFCFYTISNPARRSVWDRATKRVRCTFFLGGVSHGDVGHQPGIFATDRGFLRAVSAFRRFCHRHDSCGVGGGAAQHRAHHLRFQSANSEESDRVVPGLGELPAFAVAPGELAFDVGNVGGAALGVNTLFGLHQQMGAVVSATIAVFIFLE